MGTDNEQPRGYDINLRSGPQMREYREIVRRIRADAPARILDWAAATAR